MLADVSRLLVALLWWGLYGPTVLTNRFVEALIKRAPSVEADEITEAEGQLRAHLETLSPEEQRRLVYEVARETFACPGTEVWDETVALEVGGTYPEGRWAVPAPEALTALFADDERLWRVLACAAVAASLRTGISWQVDRARRARGLMEFFTDRSPREALAALLAPKNPAEDVVYDMLGCAGTTDVHPTPGHPGGA